MVVNFLLVLAHIGLEMQINLNITHITTQAATNFPKLTF